jgi:cell division protease FtsH
MSDNVKKATAYHETGHYVVNRLTNPGNLIVLAVSIYPTDDYSGVNMMDYNEEVTPVTNREYYISSIASDLAGRVAEEMLCGEVNSGSSSDLDAATETAEEMITELGLSSGRGRNRVYDLDGIYGNDQGSKEIDDEINDIIDEAYVFCQKLLEENRDLLDAIANALLEKRIMKKSELDEVWDATIAKRKNEEKPEKKKISVKVSVEGIPSKREVKVALTKRKKVVSSKTRKLRKKVKDIVKIKFL